MTEKPTYEDLEQRVRDLEQAAVERELEGDIYRKTHELLTFFIKHSPIYAFIKEISDMESQVIYVSDNYVDMICIPALQMVGKNMYELFPHEFAETITQDDIDVVERGLNLKLHEEFNDRNYITYKFPLTQGDKKYIAGYTVDITDIKQAEKQLEESEEKYRLLFENASQGIGYWTTDAKVISLNKIAAEDMRGSPNEFVGKSAIELFGNKQGAIFTNRIQNVAKTNQQQNYEDTVVLASGEKTFLTSYTAIQNDSGEILGVQIISTEITERNIIQRNLKESEERFKNLFESSPLPTFVWNVKDGQFFLKEINNAADLLTYGKGIEFLGISADKIYHDRPDILEHFVECITEKKNIVINTEYLSRGTGLTRQIIFTFVYISNEILMLHAEDITERKKAEENLRESEERYQVLVRNVPATVYQFILTTQGDFRFEYISENCIDLFGYSASDIKADANVVFDNIPQPDADQVYQAITESASTLTPYSIDQRFIKRDGKTIWLHASSIPRKLPNGDIIWDGMGMDITERQMALEELEKNRRILFQAERMAGVGGWEWDIVSDTWTMSDNWLQIHGCSKTELKTDELITLAHPEDIEKIQNVFRKTVEEAEPYNIEHRIVRQDTGEVRNIRAIGDATVDQTGQAIKMFGAAMDITERKRAEEEHKKLLMQIQHSQKMEAIGTLAGGIAHDFNNILGAVLGFAEMAQEESPAGSILRNDIDQVVKASHRAKDLVKQILAFSRQTESERILLQPEPIVKEALKMLRASLPKTIDIQQDIDAEAGLILADSTQIHQIIVNLCTNASQAMEGTGGTLTISLNRKTLTQNDFVSDMHVQPGDFVQLSVVDTGSGIAPDIKEKIFDPYFTTKEIGKGTGMGLAIIHGIVKSYGGFVTCHSKPGEGTAFHVYLPIIADVLLAEIESAAPEPTQLGHERILFIDDEEMLAEMGKTMLERLGYRVTVETNSIEALKNLQNQPERFDLVITDQTMPGMTGSDLARRILQIRPDLPIILCTGFSNQISEEKARIYGIKGFAMKPLAKKDLATLIRKVLDCE